MSNAGNNMARLGQKGSSGIAELNPAPSSMKEPNPEFLFQKHDLPGKRWLANMQSLGSSGKVKFFGHSDKVMNLSKLHRKSKIALAGQINLIPE
jgi:hypothetical protein